MQICLSRKQILKFSFEPKKERKYFCISTLVSKLSQIIEQWLIIMLISDYLSSNMINCIFYLTHFRELGRDIDIECSKQFE